MSCDIKAVTQKMSWQAVDHSGCGCFWLGMMAGLASSGKLWNDSALKLVFKLLRLSSMLCSESTQRCPAFGHEGPTNCKAPSMRRLAVACALYGCLPLARSINLYPGALAALARTYSP